MSRPTQGPKEEWIKRLHRAKVPLPATEGRNDALEVVMKQTEHSILYRIDRRRAGLSIPMRWTTKVRGGIPLEAFDVEMPFGEFELEQLWDPLEVGRDPLYRLPGGHEFHRNDVLNHCLPGMLHPGRGWDGFLLGVLWGDFPEVLSSRLELKITLYDGFGAMKSASVSVVVDSAVHCVPHIVDLTKRRPLFPPDTDPWTPSRRDDGEGTKRR